MMKKSLIALAIAAAAPAAFAATSNVDVYGTIDGSVTKSELKVNNVVVFDTVLVGGQPGSVEASKIGLKGTEDLGGGLKAIWQVESQIDVDGGASRTFGTRNTFAGLSGGFGTVIIGRHDTPEKLSTGPLDMFADQVGDFNTSLTIVDTRENNVVAYISPDFNGLHGAIAAVAGEQAGTTGNTDRNGLADHWSGALIYKNGPLHLSGAMTKLKSGYAVDFRDILGATDTAIGASVTAADIDIYRIGAGYTMGDLSVSAVYQNIDVDGVNAYEKGYTVGAKYNMGPIALKAQYNEREDVLKGWTVGVDYNMSKRTKAYVSYTSQEEESGSVAVDATVLTAGLRHNF